jgi:radical SAM protein with 4Fe4S-binding SPASM domain
LESGVHVITNTTMMRSNMDHLKELVDYLYDLGLRTFAMNGMIYSGGGFTNPNAIHNRELPALIAYVRDLAEERGMRFMWYTPTEYCQLSPVALGVGSKKCNAGEYSICIEPNGDILPCQSYYVSVGNILDDPWEEIWNSTLFTSFRDREDLSVEYGLPEKCISCPDILVCGAGCRIEREAEQGVRVAEMAGGGCVGCSGYHRPPLEEIPRQATRYQANDLPEGTFIPYASLVKTDLRSTGNMGIVEVQKNKEGRVDN